MTQLPQTGRPIISEQLGMQPIQVENEDIESYIEAEDYSPMIINFSAPKAAYDKAGIEADLEAGVAGSEIMEKYKITLSQFRNIKYAWGLKRKGGAPKMNTEEKNTVDTTGRTTAPHTSLSEPEEPKVEESKPEPKVEPKPEEAPKPESKPLPPPPPADVTEPSVTGYGMAIIPTKTMGHRKNEFVIPISSLNIRVGIHNLHEVVGSRGLPSTSNFHICDKATGKKSAITKPMWCDVCNRAVGTDETIKGYEISKNQYVYLEESRIKDVKASFESEKLEIIGVTKIEGGLKPEYIYDLYILSPTESKTKKGMRDAELNAKYYSLLADKLFKDGYYIIAKNYTATSEIFAAIGARMVGKTPMLYMYSLYYANELRDPTTLNWVSPAMTVQEQGLMSNLVEKMAKPVNFASIEAKNVAMFDELINQAVAGTLPPIGSAPAVPSAVAPPPSDSVDELQKALSVAAVDKPSKESRKWLIGTVAVGLATLLIMAKVLGREDSPKVEEIISWEM